MSEESKPYIANERARIQKGGAYMNDNKITITFDPSTKRARNDPYFLWFTHTCSKCGAQYHQEYAPEGNEAPPGWWINADTGDGECGECLNAAWDEAFGEENTDER